MRFQVPQFIEIEDKIFGPFTLKQFIYLAGGAGVALAAFTILPKFVAFLISTPVIALAVALAFFKVNNKPFIAVMEAVFKYLTGEKLYIWKKVDKKIVKKEGEESPAPQIFVPKLSDSKLKDLTWSISVKNPENSGGKSDKEQ
jgi:hypothetical protein